MFTSDIEHIGMPADIHFLSDIGQVQGVMERSGFLHGDVGSFKIMYELINFGPSIEGEFLVKEIRTGSEIHFRNVRCMEKRSQE